MQFHAAGVPHAEALARGAAKVSDDRVARQSLVAMGLGDIPGQRGPHGAVGVADIKPERLALLFIHVRFRLLQQLGVEHAVIERWVVLGAVQRFARMRLCGLQQFTQIQFLLLGGEPIQLF